MVNAANVQLVYCLGENDADTIESRLLGFVFCECVIAPTRPMRFGSTHGQAVRWGIRHLR